MTIKFLLSKWLVFARAIGNFQAQVILTFFYLVILLPVAVVFKILTDPLATRRKIKSNFSSWEHVKETVESARKPY